MLRRIHIAILMVFLVSLIMSPSIYAQKHVTIQGLVKDAQTGDALPGANVVLGVTSMGASTDITGKYVIRNVSAGAYTLRATYVGYRTAEVPLQVQEGTDVNRHFKLVAVGVEGETVVVTAQALGQNEAINQQLVASSIMNVVSSARIQELPDANAAESIGRLPGVSVLRDGGEGNKVVIRGLSPKYNAITVDGVRMTSTDPDDRSVDLSMISPNMLERIQVMKAITPDQDADALGGSLDFKLKEAGFGREGIGYDFQAQGGYNKLIDTYNDYKIVGSMDARFLDQRLGVFAQGNIERRNRSNDVLGASYYVNNPKLDQFNPPLISSLNLTENSRDRKRAGGTLVLDYVLPDGKIKFTNFYNAGDTKLQARSEFFNIGSSHQYQDVDERSRLNVLTNILSFQQSVDFLRMDADLSHSYSESKYVPGLYLTFMEEASGLNNADPKLPPWQIQQFARNDLSATFLDWLADYSQTSEERDYTAALNLSVDANLSDQITGIVKFGGKYRHKTRSFNYDQSGGSFYLGAGQDARQAILDAFPWMKQIAGGITGNDNLPVTLFRDNNFKYRPFFNGQYSLGVPVNIDLMWNVVDLLKRSIPAEYPRDDYSSTAWDYSGSEGTTAGYVMADMNIGPRIKCIPGVRYERLATSYTGPRGVSSVPAVWLHYPHYDTTIDRSHDFWLPMVHVRYKPLDWCDVRFAYTQTLTYPDFSAITPKIDIGTLSVDWHNVDLKPAKSHNFDLYASFYDNSIGLFTAGAFLKRIDDLIFPALNRVILDPGKYPGLGPDQMNLLINTYINNPNRVDLWGLEFDWQTHFWYLPDPFKGLVLNVNYTHVFSQAKYPQTNVHTTYTPRFTKTIVDTFYTSRLVNQPNNIVNVSIGYDYMGFSARVSMLYTANIFSTPNFWSDLNQNTEEYLRWDLSVKQDLPWYGLQLFFDLNNINGRHDLILVQGSHFPTSEQDYGLTADLGLRWRF